MERYLGIDVHRDSSTICVLGPTGKRVRQDLVETNGRSLVRYVQQLAGRRHVCFEESPWSEWLQQLPEVMRPTVELLCFELDGLTELKAQAEVRLLEEARRHRISRILRTTQPQPDTQGNLQGRRDHRDPSLERRATAAGDLPAAAGLWHAADPGTADHRSQDRRGGPGHVEEGGGLQGNELSPQPTPGTDRHGHHDARTPQQDAHRLADPSLEGQHHGFALSRTPPSKARQQDYAPSPDRTKTWPTTRPECKHGPSLRRNERNGLPSRRARRPSPQQPEPEVAARSLPHRTLDAECFECTGEDWTRHRFLCKQDLQAPQCAPHGGLKDPCSPRAGPTGVVSQPFGCSERIGPQPQPDTTLSQLR